MTELIKVKNASYILYEELLLKRENLRKEGTQFYITYLQVFGELLTESFRKKVECIRKKKMIAYCQRCLNQGKDINSLDLHQFIDAEMKSYEAQLKQMVREAKDAAEARSISDEDVRTIKEIYYRLARKIHPDMRPEYADDMQIMDYWNRIVIAYHNNQLKELEELEVLVNTCLAAKQGRNETLHIENVETKIKSLEQEIDRIVSTAPYTYRFLLEDNRQKEAKKEELQQEIKEYEQYAKELDDVLKAFPIKEMYA